MLEASDLQIGPYTIQQLIGSGGMADVYLAWDHANRWPVALKVLRGAGSQEERRRRRFDREADVLMKLRHPHIVQVYNTGRAPDGRPYIAMEYIAGGDLMDLMHARRGNRLPVTEAVYLMRRVAGAMAYAHQHGVIHRDLKPSNILLRAESGEPVVADLGIAALAGANPLTGTMEALGTPQYMAPEQVAKDVEVDARADVYAVGVMLFELLTGRLPLDAENGWALLLRKQQEDAPPILSVRRDLSPQLAAVVDACLQRDPAARYQSAAALATALDAFLPADARPPGPVPVRGRKPLTPDKVSPPSTPSDPRQAGKSPGYRSNSASSRRPSTLLWAGGTALALLLLLAFVFSTLGRGRGNGTNSPVPDDVPQTTNVSLEVTVPSESSQSVTRNNPEKPTSTLAVAVSDVTDEANGTESPATGTATRRPPTATPRSTGTIVRATRDVYVRSGPGTGFPIVGGLSRNEQVAVHGSDRGANWYLVTVRNGDAWVPADFVVVVSGSAAAIAVAATIPALPTSTSTTEPTAAAETPVVDLPIDLLSPRLADCPPAANAPAYSVTETINFSWNWPGTPPAGGYLEVRAGPVGRIVSQGVVDPAVHRQGDVWTYPVSGSVLYQPGDGAYQWAVYLISGEGQVLLNSPLSCFGILGSGSPVPPEVDSDGDGVPDSQDRCPNDHAGANPDPDRPGCPKPIPPPDSDGDGIPDNIDQCPNEKPGPYPDPGRPGCPRPYP